MGMTADELQQLQARGAADNTHPEFEALLQARC
jgi:hypothetical protein